MHRFLCRCRRMAAGSMAAALLAAPTLADASDFYINEIYFDPPGGLDESQELIELRGPAGASLAGHYLVFLESERSIEETDPDPDGAQGGVDNIFDLGAFSFGSNGFLTFRQSPAANPAIPGQNLPQIPVNPAANNLTNSGPGIGIFNSPPGFGNGVNSTVGASDDGGQGRVENGAFSALLIRNDTGLPITLDDDFDGDNDGELDQFVFDNFTILDSVGVAEPDETNPAFYAEINYAFTGATGATASGTGQVVTVPFEIEYVGRWGNSTGSEPEDFLVTNLTDSANSGTTGIPDFRVSTGDPQPQAGSGDVDGDGVVESPPGALAPGVSVEANKDIPFGLPILSTAGAPNFISGDFNGDGFVTTADYTVWRDSFGETGTQANPLAADHNRDFIVNELDYQIFVDNFGSPSATAAVVASTPAPEPASVASTLVLLAGLLSRRRR